jgi:hypothetical protein
VAWRAIQKDLESFATDMGNVRMSSSGHHGRCEKLLYLSIQGSNKMTSQRSQSDVCHVMKKIAMDLTPEEESHCYALSTAVVSLKLEKNKIN